MLSSRGLVVLLAIAVTVNGMFYSFYGPHHVLYSGHFYL